MSDSAAESVFRILLVEDAPDQSLLLSAVLQKLGPFDVTLVQDGVQALELARRDGFDLVLTDLNLPGMDGFELTRELKAAFPKLPVLAATGYADPSYVEGAYRAGVDALMTKPVDPEDLEARLRELLPRWRAADERPPCVLAVGAHPGEVELGCAASLAAHRAAGHDVVVVLLVEPHRDERPVKRARKAAEHLGVRLLVPEEPADDAEGGGWAARLEEIVAELKPTWAYIPSAAERDPSRRNVHGIAAAALRSVPTVLAYAGATTSLDFAPSVFRDVERWMDTKLGALAYHQSGHRDPSTSPDFALAQARYWGRFKDFGEVEPFELVDGGVGPDEVQDSGEARPAALDTATLASLEDFGVTVDAAGGAVEPEAEVAAAPEPESEVAGESEPDPEVAEASEADAGTPWESASEPESVWESIPEPETVWESAPEPAEEADDPWAEPEESDASESAWESAITWAPEPDPEPDFEEKAWPDVEVEPRLDGPATPEVTPPPAAPEPIADFEPFLFTDETPRPAPAPEPGPPIEAWPDVELAPAPEHEPPTSHGPEVPAPEPEPAVEPAPAPQPEPPLDAGPPPPPPPAPRRTPPPPIMPGRMPAAPGLPGHRPDPHGSDEPGGSEA